MKLSLIFVLICVILSGCGRAATIGIIGGADGPTSIFVGEGSGKAYGQFGEQYEKKAIRMFNIDGDLYYDTGLVSDNTPRCGTLDGELKKAVAENEIPKNHGEANFNADGYQNATEITKEVPIDSEWLIFRKFDNALTSGKGKLKYCFYIKGRLNNAAKESEIIVLSDDKDITFSEAYEPMLRSYIDDNGPAVSFKSIIPGDEWGILLYPENVTNKGMTLRCEQLGGEYNGELQTGEAFSLEININDKWEQLEPLHKNIVWNALAYKINNNGVTQFEIDWEYIYGELKPGTYKLNKEIMDYIQPGEFKEKNYEIYFNIK